MLKKFLFCLIAGGMLLPVCAQNLPLKKGGSVDMKDVLGKDQYGIMVAAGKDKETGETLRRFIPFVELSPAALTNFPFCDTKAVERIDNAVQDRLELIRKKFRKRYPDFEGAQDFTANLTIHSGVPKYSVLFTATESIDNGLIGFLYSDAADALFYGKVCLYGLIGSKDSAWIGTIYPTEKTVKLNGSTYSVFTVIPPPEKTFLDQQDDEKKMERRRKGTARGNVPPPR